MKIFKFVCMKSVCIFISLIINFIASTQLDSLNINFVDIKENENSKIIHYVNGKYKIKNKQKINIKKIKYLEFFVQINPIELTDEKSTLKITTFRNKFISDKFYEELNTKNIQEWSLNSEIGSIYYFPNFNKFNIKQKDSISNFFKINFDSTIYHQEEYDPKIQKYITKNYVKYKLDSLDYIKYENAAKKHRDSLNDSVNELLTPFYISRYEITNRQYRQFVNWVLDSLALKLLYDSLSNEQAILLLNIPKKTIINPLLKVENL